MKQLKRSEFKTVVIRLMGIDKWAWRFPLVIIHWLIYLFIDGRYDFIHFFSLLFHLLLSKWFLIASSGAVTRRSNCLLLYSSHCLHLHFFLTDLVAISLSDTNLRRCHGDTVIKTNSKCPHFFAVKSPLIRHSLKPILNTRPSRSYQHS